MAQNNNGDVILARRVGDFLRRELKNRRMQQYKFAMDFGCGERTVNRWINEGVDSLADVVEIADFFDVSVRDVLFGDDDVPLVLRNLSGRMKILPDFFIFRQNVACYDEKIAIQCGCRGEKAAFFRKQPKSAKTWRVTARKLRYNVDVGKNSRKTKGDVTMNTLETVVLSKHGEMRLAQREGLSSKRAQNYADRAWRNGKTVDEYIGPARVKLERVQARAGAGKTVRIFANGCYIFSNDGVLVTEYPFSVPTCKKSRPKRERYEDDITEQVA